MFISSPGDFSSFREDLIFEYEQEEATDLTFTATIVTNTTSFDVKKLYNVTSAKINLSPIIANLYMPYPVFTSSALKNPKLGYIRAFLSCGDESTPSRDFYASKREFPENGMISTMPTSRTISYGEGDEIWIHAGMGSQIDIVAEAYDEGGVTTTSFVEWVEECEIIRFRLDTHDFSSYTKCLKLSIYRDGELTDEVVYYFIPSTQGAVRLAWIGDYGAIEQYTFPVTNSLTKTKSGSRIYEIESAYEKSSTIEALSEILISEKLWIADSEGYYEVQLLSTTAQINTNGELSTITYKLERYD